ncbi:L-lactate permease [Moellerella wisconsensis]|uniref:L-lactate permease n=2 Tax=Moellerella wisconsensis TaxID=158849 RepID=A0ACD3YAY9_9GAMM|nr:L-lactate permease [Moellerella wisconsensis]KLN96912.1 lactate permease [Moellerella wisconsensis]UNH24511.1 L-lactate permease [Moellerella wisconsensis]UNH27616.1 L-lactate permease [Moellerella wisconsensis]UNH31089.1 L-lactate permease [Moellerella wisconsensis]UNH39236.1 L-lactate permease [Moellerella wisconsensis]
MSLFLSVAPIIMLIWMMTKRRSLPSYIALPLTALVIYGIQLIWFKNDYVLLNANIITAFISVLTPISIIAGAILLNKLMQISGAENTLRAWLENISPNPVAQIMIIGWAFAFTIEGASGFGTPAAIAAPILVGIGFPPIRVALLTLIMNSVPVSFGAVGTPTWFGFAMLGLSDDSIFAISHYTALIHFVAGFIIPLVALRFIVSTQQIKQNIVYILLSVVSCSLPYFLLAQINYEFPALVGGAIGLMLSVLIARMGIGLKKCERKHQKQDIPFAKIIKAMTPTLLLIVILIITRIHQLGIKDLLNSTAVMWQFNLGFLGNVTISKALIFQLSNVFDTGASANYKTLYVPALLPFFVVVFFSIGLFRLNRQQVSEMFSQTANQIKKPFIALFGALIMVNLMMQGGNASPVIIIGSSLAGVTGHSWLLFSSYLGALGTFFSGSNTVSNLTFGGIQQSIAQSLGLNINLTLALQSVGGAMGNMVCLNNIIAVCTILGITKSEGDILKKTVLPMMLYGVIAAIMALILSA